MRNLTFVLLCTALATGVALVGRGEDPKKTDEQKPDPKKVKELMHRKLEYSQKLLEALALNDLDNAAKSAEDLIRVRKEVSWMVIKTPEYEIWSDEFERSAKSVIKAAKVKNLEEAKLNYLGLTLACFHCHTYTRDMGRR
jgi:hypothetical protein